MISRHCRGLPTKICRHSHPMPAARSTARWMADRMLTWAPTRIVVTIPPAPGRPFPPHRVRPGVRRRLRDNVVRRTLPWIPAGASPPAPCTAVRSPTRTSPSLRRSIKRPPSPTTRRRKARVFEAKVALLEGAEDALATASGMAAVSTAVLASLRRGDHAVTPAAVYQATYQLFAHILPE